MKNTKLLRAIGGVDDELIEAAASNGEMRPQTQAGRKRRLLRWVIPVAACLVIAIGVFAGRNALFVPPVTSDNNPPIQTGEQATNNPGTIDSGDNTIIPGLPDEVWPPEPSHSVYIPKIELPKNTNGAEMDMIGLFVYQGRIYTQAAWYYNDDAQYIIDNLVGEKIGFAKGNIDEWSTQDDYAFEFAGSVYGDVYTVKGHDSWFRLCMTGVYEMPIITDDGVATDENGNALRQWVNFYECLNGYGMTNGYDLFVFDSLMEVRNAEILSKNWSHVKYQDHDNWNKSSNKYRDLTGVSDEDISSFFYEVYFGQFENTHETIGVDKFYDTENQTHVYVYMKDGTRLDLRLMEGGYVGYQHLAGYFVKIPGEAFDKIFNACK